MSGVIWEFEIALDDEYVWIGDEMGVRGVNVVYAAVVVCLSVCLRDGEWLGQVLRAGTGGWAKK